MVIGPLYGYFPNGSKTHVLAKPHHVEAAKEIFKGTGMVNSTEGEGYLGGALGTSSFVRQLPLSSAEHQEENPAY